MSEKQTALLNKLCKLERCLATSAISRSRRVYYAQIFCKIQYVCDTIYGHFSWQYSILDICHSYFILEPRFGDFNFSWGKSRTFTYLIERFFKMACSPIFGFFRDTFFFMNFTRSCGPSTVHIEYYGTSWRCLAAILADLQAIIGIRPRKHEISLKMDSDGSNLL